MHRNNRFRQKNERLDHEVHRLNHRALQLGKADERCVKDRASHRRKWCVIHQILRIVESSHKIPVEALKVPPKIGSFSKYPRRFIFKPEHAKKCLVASFKGANCNYTDMSGDHLEKG
ncbi:hypothetical protein ACOME3_007528 [Neoechinorhynchus agilis]